MGRGRHEIGPEGGLLVAAPLGPGAVDVIAEINEQMPRTRGESFVPFSRVNAFIATNRPQNASVGASAFFSSFASFSFVSVSFFLLSLLLVFLLFVICPDKLLILSSYPHLINYESQFCQTLNQLIFVCIQQCSVCHLCLEL